MCVHVCVCVCVCVRVCVCVVTCVILLLVQKRNLQEDPQIFRKALAQSRANLNECVSE